MTDELAGKTIAFLVAMEGIEQVELTEPWKAVEEAGGTPVLLAPETGKVQGYDHLDKADTFEVDRAVGEAQPADYAAVVLPGGVANPDQLRTVPEAVRFVHQAADAGTPIAAICHAPWTLIDAGVASGRRLTSWPSLSTDLTNAGAEWVDEELVVDRSGPGPLITSRKPDDLPAFCRALVETVSG
ncbi:MAG TPA: type 1 glutamine amidotransferase domain-containing protein [Acidimicrobiales bacterium]|nr:type 1 glutamine amidotransferase domain-containing protein [Acidimicrobiales bacterium]